MSNFANKHRGEINLSLGDSTLLLRPSYTAISEWEDKTGMGSVQILYRLSSSTYRVAEIVAIVGAAARAGGHKITDAQAGDMLIDSGVLEVVPVVAKMLAACMTGGKEPDPEGEAPAAEAMPSPTTVSPSAA
jgi:hypothetical protein